MLTVKIFFNNYQKCSAFKICEYLFVLTEKQEKEIRNKATVSVPTSSLYLSQVKNRCNTFTHTSCHFIFCAFQITSVDIRTATIFSLNVWTTSNIEQFYEEILLIISPWLGGMTSNASSGELLQCAVKKIPLEFSESSLY